MFPNSPKIPLFLDFADFHGGHPVLRRMIDNIYIRTDPAGNKRLTKKNPQKAPFLVIYLNL